MREEGIYYANHVVNPFFYEGMKAYIYEVYEELGRIPEHVVLPVGNGTLFIGAVKALEHLLESGAIDHFPKIVALQSEYCDPLLKARELGLDAPVSIDVKPTIAEGIAIGKPLRGSELLEMMKKNGKEEYRTADEVRKDLEILKTLQQKGAHPQVILDALKEKLKNKTIEIDERLLNQVKCEN